MEDDDWIFLGDGGTGGSDTDSASDAGSDSDSGFAIVRRGGRNQCSSVVVSDDAPAPPRVADVAVPHPTPPGLSIKVVSYAEAFSASASTSSSSEDDGGGRELPGCSDEATAGAGEAVIQRAGIDDDAAGTGSTDDCTVTCKEGCESDSDPVGEHDGTGSSVSVEAPSVAVAAAPTVSCPETTTAPVLHGEAHSELASGMDMDVDQGGAEDMEVEDEESGSCEEDAGDDDTGNSSEDEEDTDSSSDEEDEDEFSYIDEEDEDTFSYSDEEDTFSSGDEDDLDTFRFSSGDEEYTESFSEEEYTAEIYSEDDDDDAESSGEEEGSENSDEMDYVEISGEESHDADSTVEEEDDDDAEVSGEDQEEEEDDDDAECSDEVDDAESTGEEEEEGDHDPEISGEDKEGSNAECSGEENDVESSGKEEESSHVVDKDTDSSDSDMDTDTSGSGSDMDTDSSDMEDGDCCCLEPHEEADIADGAENGNQAIFAMLFPKAKVVENGNQGIFAMLFPKAKVPDIFALLLPKDKVVAENGNQAIFAMLFPKAKVPDIFALLLPKDKVVAENGNQDIFAMLFPKAKACGANIDDYEDESEHGYVDYEGKEEEEDESLFDMLLPRDHAIDGDNIDTGSSGMEDSCLESDEEDGIVNVAEKSNQYISDMLLLPRAPACNANIEDDYEDESEHVSIDYEEEDGSGSLFDDHTDSSDGEDEASLYGLPRATTGGGVESQCCGVACQSLTERQALWEDLRRQLAAEAFESSGQQQQERSYDGVDDTCDLPGKAAPAGSCARTAEAQFTARAVRDTERALAMEEARRREAAQRELDRSVAREAAAAAEALESALEDCATAERKATGDVVTRPAVAEPAVTVDITFIICLYVLVYLVVSLLSLGLS